MSLILVVEQEDRYVERIRDALASEGWRAQMVGDHPEAVRAASSEAPNLVLVSTEVAGASSLYASFARKSGGPGVVALVPEHRAGELSAEALAVDEVLVKPFTDQDLRLVVRRSLAGRPATPPRPAPQPSGDDGKLTSRDIFGDLVEEIEAELAEQQPADAPAAPPPAAAPAMAAPAAAAAPSALKPAAPASPAGRDDDLARKLEETLTGVLADSGPAARRRRVAVDDDDGVDALLSQTLSGFGLGDRVKKKPAPGQAKPPAATPPAAPRSHVYIKSGCFKSGEGPGYGRRFDGPCVHAVCNGDCNGDNG
jgi:CheY-like chemotaxis protein